MLKKYDEIIPIGRDCLVATTLLNIGVRKNSYPFDWLYRTDNEFFARSVDCILNNFRGFFDYNSLKFIENNELHQTDLYKNTTTGFYFLHDFPINSNKFKKFFEIKKKI